MKLITIFSLVCVLFILILFESAFPETRSRTWRCGKEVVQVGDSKSSVLLKCGPPTVKDISESDNTGSFTSRTRGSTSRGTYKETTQTTEEWAYNCGPGRFITYLTFRGRKLISIVSGEYGSGESYCNGARNNPNNQK